jgi:hypothetical protein
MTHEAETKKYLLQFKVYALTSLLQAVQVNARHYVSMLTQLCLICPKLLLNIL